MPRPLLITLVLALTIGLCCFVVWPEGGLSAATSTEVENPSTQEGQLGAKGSGRQPARTGIPTEDPTETVVDSTPVRGGVVLGDRVLSGQVLDEDHEPLAGAWVLTAEEGTPVATDEDGSFEIPLGPDRYWWTFSREVIAWKEGMTLVRKEVRQIEGVVLVLEKEELVGRRVEDGDSQLALPGAEARILVEVEADRVDGFFQLGRYVELPLELAPADDNGMIRIPDPGKSDRFSIEVQHRGYETFLSDFRAVRQERPIRLSKPTEIRVQFVDAEDRPHAKGRIAFPWTRNILDLDAQGWVQLPPEGRWGLWSVQLIDQDRRWIFLGVGEDQVYDGAVIATHSLPRHGKLVPEGGESPDLYEVATSATWNYWSRRYEPDPSDTPEALIWAPVKADGSFETASGWQGVNTAIHVRKIGERRILHSEDLKGEGPYEIALAAAVLVQFTVHADPPQVLEGAALELISDDDDSLTTVEIGSGSGESMLTNGGYSLRLQLAGYPHKFPLGDFEVQGQTLDLEYWFEGVHALNGQVSAGGQAVFPCQVDIHSDDGFRTKVDTDPEGRWVLEGAPHRELFLRIRPEDDWIEPVTGVWQSVGPFQDQVHTDIPVARLLVSVGNYPPHLLDRISAQRMAPSGTNGHYVNGRSNISSTSVKLPDLSAGPAEFRLAPGVVRFQSSDNDHPLADTRIELAANEVAGFVLSTPPVGKIRIRVQGLTGQLWGNYQVEDIHVPLADEYPTFVPVNASRRSGVDGLVGNPRVVLPGRYRVILSRPVWSRDLNGQVGDGRAEIEVEVIEGQSVEALFYIDQDGFWQVGDGSQESSGQR